MSTPLEPRETIRIGRPPGLQGVEVLEVEHGARLLRLYMDRYAFCAVRSSGCEQRYRGRELNNTAGTVAPYEPGELMVDQRLHGRPSFVALFIDPELVTGAARELDLGGEPHFGVCGVRNGGVHQTLVEACGALLDGDSLLEQQVRLAESLHGLLAGYAERRLAAGKADRPVVARAREYLHSHWSEDVRLDALAKAAFTSKYHLVRVFKAATGVPPHEYLRHLRIARARRMLASGRAISATAFACGYADQAHLTRTFKSAVGVTPGQYARAAGGR